jgi:hypothetical protein
MHSITNPIPPSPPLHPTPIRQEQGQGKRCTRCGSSGPFRTDLRSSTGLTSWCSRCLSEKSRECRLKRLDHYREVNRECAKRRGAKKKGIYIPRPRAAECVWTVPEEDILVRQYRKGVDIEALAQRMGRTRTAVRSHAQEMGLRLDGKDWRNDDDFYLEEGAG